MLFKFYKENGPIKELVSSSLWSIVGTLISKVLLFVIWIIVARLLSPGQYGEFSIIKSTTLMFADFVGFSFSIAATKYIAQYSLCDKRRVEKLIGLFLISSIVIGFVAFIMVYLSANWICSNFFKAEYLFGYLQCSSIVMLVSILNNSQLGILRGFNCYKEIAKINTIQVLLSFPIYILGTYFWGIRGAVWAYVFYNVVICFLSHYEIRKYCKINYIIPTYKGFYKELHIIVSYVFPYFLSMLLTVCSQWYNESRVVSLGNAGFVQLGYYSAVNVIQTMIVSVAIMVCSPFVPIMAKYRQNGENISGVEKLNMLLPLYMSLFIAIPLMLFPEVISLFYGVSYANDDMYVITVIVISYTVLIIYKQALARSVAVYEMQWIYLLDSILLAISFVFGFYYLFYLGIKGLVFTFLFSYIFSTLVFTPIYIHKKMLLIGIFKSVFLWQILLCAIIAGCSYFVLENIYYRVVLFIVMLLFVLYCIKIELRKYGFFKN